MRIIDWRHQADGSCAAGIDVAQIVGHSLQSVRSKLVFVKQDVVQRRTRSSQQPPVTLHICDTQGEKERENKLGICLSQVGKNESTGCSIVHVHIQKSNSVGCVIMLSTTVPARQLPVLSAP